MVKESASGNVSGFLSEVTSTSLSSINLALAFMVALAWNEVAKDAVSRHFMTPGAGLQNLTMYAVAVTLLAALVFRVSRRVDNSQQRVDANVYTVSR